VQLGLLHRALLCDEHALMGLLALQRFRREFLAWGQIWSERIGRKERVRHAGSKLCLKSGGGDDGDLIGLQGGLGERGECVCAGSVGIGLHAALEGLKTLREVHSVLVVGWRLYLLVLREKGHQGRLLLGSRLGLGRLLVLLAQLCECPEVPQVPEVSHIAQIQASGALLVRSSVQTGVVLRHRET
jgi:hypothetical protein